MENEFEAGGRKFKLGKIDPFRQFHIVRRIGPILADIIPALAGLSKSKANSLSEAEKLEEFAGVLQPLMAGFSKLSDADADYVLFRLLSSVEVHQPQFSVWSKVANDTGIIMQDIDLPILLQAAAQAFMFNLTGFFASLPRK